MATWVPSAQVLIISQFHPFLHIHCYKISGCYTHRAAPIPSDAASRGPPPQQPIKQSMATRSIQQPFPSHAQQQRVHINHDRARQGARIREQLGRKKFVNNSNSSNGPDNGQHRFKTGRSSQQHQPQSLPQKFRSTASKKSEFESIKDTTNPTEISTQFGSEQRRDEKSWPIKAFHIRHTSTKGITAVEVILTKHDSSVPLRQARSGRGSEVQKFHLPHFKAYRAFKEETDLHKEETEAYAIYPEIEKVGNSKSEKQILRRQVLWMPTIISGNIRAFMRKTPFQLR
ncbi:hypothetical protein ACLOJK_007561 [Asimina triloba]